MFRLTWDGPDALRLRPQQTPQRQRVYRWENKWGVLLSTGDWYAEARLPVAHGQREGTRFLLETVETLEDEAPPYAIDDAWDEDVVPMGGGSAAGGSMSVRGTAKELVAWLSKHGLGVPPAFTATLSAV